MAGMLYLVPTPIGNLSDISPRCRQTLAEADFIAAEDTRVSLKLLNHLELKKSLVSYHEHNKAESGEKILARLLAGETCALVTDAGSPAISDPGEDLVRLCAEHGVTVCAIPGPCALVTALITSARICRLCRWASMLSQSHLICLRIFTIAPVPVVWEGYFPGKTAREIPQKRRLYHSTFPCILSDKASTKSDERCGI